MNKRLFWGVAVGVWALGAWMLWCTFDRLGLFAVLGIGVTGVSGILLACSAVLVKRVVDLGRRPGR